MGVFTDLTGMQSGVLIAKEYLGNSQWDCECVVCGNHITISSYWFKKNIQIGREGCKHVKPVQIGDLYGDLTVVEQDKEYYVKPKSGRRERKWVCRCTCGRTKSVLEDNLKSFKTTSCGLCGNRISIPEKAVLFYLSKCFPNIQENYRPEFLDKKEIDVYIPELKLGIEYDGERWHKEIEKDILKNRVCSNNGITLLRIREPECIQAEELLPCIVTPKPLTNGSHMTKPIEQLIAYINDTYHRNIVIDVNCLRDSAEICKTVINSRQANSLAEERPEIAKEWDYDRNAPLTPDLVAAHSSKKAYWKCEKGHSYASVIASRTGDDACGCPVCSNRGMALYQNGRYIGEHSLSKCASDIAKEFDEKKNGMSADNIAVSSNKKVWWKCAECGYEWQSKINNRTSTLKTGCPQCAKTQNKQGKKKRENLVAKKGSLFDHYPELCKEWAYDKNEIEPTAVSFGSGQKVWWICSNGHYYEACINHRTSRKPTGCPYCTNRKVLEGYNDLATTHPQLLEEWNFEKNSIKPTEILSGTERKVWWRCCYCQEEYEAAPEKRSDKPLGCVRCRKTMKQNLSFKISEKKENM